MTKAFDFIVVVVQKNIFIIIEKLHYVEVIIVLMRFIQCEGGDPATLEPIPRADNYNYSPDPIQLHPDFSLES